MNCTEISPLLSAYMDKELPDDEYKSVHRHLGTCHACTEIVKDLERISIHMQQSFSQLYAPEWLEHAIEYQIDDLRETEQASHLRTAAEFGTFLMTLSVIGILLSPVGKAVWSLANLASRLSHGMYVLLLHIIIGNGWILGGILICTLVTLMSLYAIKKVMQNTIIHIH